MSQQIAADQPMSLNQGLAERIQEELGQNVYLCYQCVKCTSGCPVSEFFDWQPNQVMRAMQLGQEEMAFESETPYLCASCQTCTTRCPQGLDIAGIMDFLVREAKVRGYESKVPEVNQFNEAFMRQVNLWGRSYELGMTAELKLRSGNITGDLDLGFKLFQKGKLPILPSRAGSRKHPRQVEDPDNTVAYYPGCSLHATASEFNSSSKAVCEALDLKLVEPKGWLCCGSSAAHRCDPETALQLPMENLALIEQSGFKEVTMPCAACFNRHKSALHEIRNHEDEKLRVNDALGYEYQDSVEVTTLTQAILNRVGPAQVAAKVTKPLAGLKAVCYYGCLLTRPADVTGADHPENPTDMDALVKAMGAEVLDWSYKTVCCGASHSLTRPDIVHKLGSNLITHAQETGADIIVVACPLCHTNLDARQFQMGLDEAMPVLYFTQLAALALGLPAKAAALDKNLTDPRPLLHAKGIV